MKSGIKLFVDTENLAVPEVHTAKKSQAADKSSNKKAPHITVRYDTAVPEIIIKPKK